MLDKIGCVIPISCSIGALGCWITGKRKKTDINPSLENSKLQYFIRSHSTFLQLFDKGFHIGLSLFIG